MSIFECRAVWKESRTSPDRHKVRPSLSAQAKAYGDCSEVQSIPSVSQQASLGHDKKIFPFLSGATVVSRQAKAVGRSVGATAAVELEE